MKKFTYAIFTIVLPLGLGVGLCLFLCPDVWFIKIWMKFIGTHRQRIQYGYIGRFIRNYLLDFLWAYALANSVWLIDGENKQPIFFNVLNLRFRLMHR